MADSRRFIKFSRDCIEEAPLQTYSSALLFAPENSLVKKTFVHRLPKWILGRSELAEHWETQQLDPLAGHLWPLDDLKFTVDESRVASLDTEHNLIIWDLSTGVSLLETQATCIDVSAKNVLACGHGNGDISLWLGMEDEILQPLFSAVHHKAPILRVKFSPDGTFLASCDRQQVFVWNTVNIFGQLLPSDGFPLGWEFEALLGFSPESDGDHFLAAYGTGPSGKSSSREKTIAVWIKPCGNPWALHDFFVCGDAFKGDGAFVGTSLVLRSAVSGTQLRESKLSVRDTRKKTMTHEIGTRSSYRLFDGVIAPVPGTNTIIAHDTEGSLRSYDLDKPTGSGTVFEGLTFENSQSVRRQHVSAEGGLLIGDCSGDIGIWDVRTGRRLVVSTDTGITNGAIFPAPRGTMVAVNRHYSKSISIYDCKALCRQTRPSDKGAYINDQNDPLLSPNGRFIAARLTKSAQDSKLDRCWTMGLWDTEGSFAKKEVLVTDNLVSRYHRHWLSFSPQAQWFALVLSGKSSGTSDRLEIWNLESSRSHGPTRPTFSADLLGMGQTRGIAFSNDSRHFALVSNTEIRVYELGVWKESRYPQSCCYHVYDFASLGQSSFYQVLKKDSFFHSKDTCRIRVESLCFEEPPKMIYPEFSVRGRPMWIVYSPSNSLLAVAEGLCQLFDLAQQPPQLRSKHSDRFMGGKLSFCNSGCCLSGSLHGLLPLWRVWRTSQSAPQPSCSCGTAPIRVEEQWLYYGLIPFLRLPNSLHVPQIMVSQGTVMLWETGAQALSWYKFAETLEDYSKHASGSQKHRFSGFESESDTDDTTSVGSYIPSDGE